MNAERRATRVFVVTAFAIAVGASLADEPKHVCVPLGGGPNGIAELTLPDIGGLTASAERQTATDNSPALLRISFDKSGQERRLLAIEGKLSNPVAGATVVAVTCRINAPQNAARLALVVFETDGGAWYRLTKPLFSSEDLSDIRIPLGARFSRCRFATDADDDIRWDQVDRVWLGLLIDGPGTGVWDIRRAVFTDEPFRPDGPLALKGQWSLSHDQNVRGELSLVDDASRNGPAMKYTFRMPGGRHMYAVPRLPVQVDELDSYSGLRFTYKAELPAGIAGLLVMLIEADGTQYYADPAPAAAADWTTVAIPFEKFQRGAWSSDENDQLDLNQVHSIAIGMHGTAQPAEASGQIMAADVQFVP